jgi:nucleotide-binding universal stress UspA family protein
VWEGGEEAVANGKRYLEEVAGQLQPYCLGVNVHVLQDEPASAIARFADLHPEVKLIAMSTHGRSGLGRLVFGSVAEQVLHLSPVPLLVAKPAHEAPVLDPVEVPSYTTLLVPLDGSEFSAQALTEAKSLARALGRQTMITLLTAVNQPLLGSELSPLPLPSTGRTYEKETQANNLQHTKQQLQNEGFQVETILESGPPAEAILRVADSTNASLIVMATHGRSGLGRIWPGSVAMKVVHNAPCPVLLVRSKERVKETEQQQAKASLELQVPGFG